MNIRRTAVVAVAALAVAASALAQDSGRGSASATVGGKAVSVDYGRPALKGRAVDELLKQLPADRMWRAGKDHVTTLTTEGDVTIGGTRVPAGKYTVYVHADEGAGWSFVLNKDQGVPLGKIWAQAPEARKNDPYPHMADYEKNAKATEVVRAKMTPAKAAQPAELFTIALAPKGQSAELTMQWGTQAWSVEIAPAK